jgi:hypothetical protein
MFNLLCTTAARSLSGASTARPRRSLFEVRWLSLIFSSPTGASTVLCHREWLSKFAGRFVKALL